MNGKRRIWILAAAAGLTTCVAVVLLLTVDLKAAMACLLRAV